jgi:uncharacterized integral membrane protein
MTTMSEQPYGAPSPADRPTTPGTAAVSRTEVSGVPGVSGDRTPSEDRPTVPAERPTIPDGAAGSRPRTQTQTRTQTSPGRTRIGGTWIGLILGAVVLVFLLVFILQNLGPARVVFLGLEGTLPLGIWLLFAAIAGVLLLAIPGLGRMVQWRRAGKGTGRARS